MRCAFLGNHPQFNCTECSYDLLKDFFIPMITGNLKISLKPEWTEIKSIHWLESFKLFFRYPDRALEFSPLWTLPQVLQYFSRNKSQKIHDVLEILSPFIRKYHRYFSLFLCFFSSFRSHEFNFSSGFVTRNLLNSIFGSSGRNRLTSTKNLKLEYIEIRIYSQVTNVVMLLQLEFPVLYFLFLKRKKKGLTRTLFGKS